MSMEKYGIEKDDETNPEEKTAGEKCNHPPDKIKKDGKVRFCTACNKYLEEEDESI